MGARGAVAVALLVVALALMVVALVLLIPAVVALRERPLVLRAMTRVQRRRMDEVVRRGGPVDPDEVAGARAVAAISAGQGYSALGSAGGAALMGAALVFPWSPGAMPWWVRAFFTVGLVVQGVAAVTALRNIRRGRGFLAAHPDPDPVSVVVAR